MVELPGQRPGFHDDRFTGHPSHAHFQLFWPACSPLASGLEDHALSQVFRPMAAVQASADPVGIHCREFEDDDLVAAHCFQHHLCL